jgi:hypothetical protein
MLEGCTRRSTRWRRTAATSEWLMPSDMVRPSHAPAWNAVGHWLTRGAPASDRQILALALIAPILLATLWVLPWRTLGWQAASARGGQTRVRLTPRSPA